MGKEKIIEFVARVKKELDTGKPFKFWIYVEELSNLSVEFEEKVEGEVEENVKVEGKLSLGKGSVVLAGTRIEGNASIGENCKIGPNAYLRGNVVVGDNCHVGMSEVKNSVLLDKANAPHFNYVGDSLLGEEVNLGAGAKIANLRFDNKNVKVEMNGELVDSGRRKLGACIGNKTKTGANVTINCGVIVANGSRIAPNEFVSRNTAGSE